MGGIVPLPPEAALTVSAYSYSAWPSPLRPLTERGMDQEEGPNWMHTTVGKSRSPDMGCVIFFREWEQTGGQSEEWITSEIPLSIPSQALGFPKCPPRQKCSF